ncbi:MAG: hypothetical protein LBG62_02305 [Candidatus Methanoplasma sp.]|jgi:hypothetical protein|nr:hypothetical protein [Candidatus Methanoplasma sp.]
MNVVLISIILVTITISAASSPDTGGRESYGGRDDCRPKATGASVAVVTDDLGATGFASLIRSESLDSRAVRDLESVKPGEIALIDQKWHQKQDKGRVDGLVRDFIGKGGAILAIGDPGIFSKNGSLAFSAFSDDADVYGAYFDFAENRYACLSVDCGDAAESLDEACFRATDAARASKGAVLASGSGISWGQEYQSTLIRHYSGYGWLNVMTMYTVVEESNARYNYYQTHYRLQSVPESGARTADMYISSQHNQNNMALVDYSPTTSSGSSTVGVSVGASVATGGTGSISLTGSWQYSVSDVMVIDQSNFGTNSFSTWHNVDETKSVGSATYVIEPGKVTKVDCQSGARDGAYRCYENYSIQFQKNGAMKKYSERLNVTIIGLPCEITYDTNGADEYFGPEGAIYPIGSFSPAYSATYSRGTTVAHSNHNYWKTGSVFAGYSTDPNATAAQYAPYSTFVATCDMTLYMVWI